MDSVLEELVGLRAPADRGPLRQLPLPALTAACRAETRKFLRAEPHDDAFALELLSRVVCAGDFAAWEGFVALYGGVILNHIRRLPAYAATSEDDSFWLGRTLQRFVGAVGPDRLDLFPNFAAVLQYLKMCAHSVMLDEVRARRGPGQMSLEMLSEDVNAGIDVERSVVARQAASELWDAVARELPEESERLVARLSFKLGYKPAEIHARCTDRFASVADVYRVKRNLLERLRRSPRLQHLLGSDSPDRWRREVHEIVAEPATVAAA